jgi:hypothetical protein
VTDFRRTQSGLADLDTDLELFQTIMLRESSRGFAWVRAKSATSSRSCADNPKAVVGIATCHYHSSPRAKMGAMKPRLLIVLLIIVGLAAITPWAEYTSWKEAAGLEQQLKSSELHRVLALSDNWTAADREALRDVITDAQISLVNLRAWLIASSAGVLVLAMLLGRTVHQEMIAPLKKRLVESHAVITRQEKLASLGVLAAGVGPRNP